jgi:glucitol operon activator protein
MSFWAAVILLLAILWILQIVGTYFQMRHYREVLGKITDEESSGYIGVGNAKSSFGKGVILILVVDEAGEVFRALRMRGISVFARFKAAPDLVGLDELRDEKKEGPYEASTMLAASRAVEQIDRIKAEKEEKKEESVAVG